MSKRNSDEAQPRNMLGRTMPSDECLIEEIYQALAHHPVINVDDVDVVCEDGEIVLRGDVVSHEAKALAEGLAKAVPGVKSVTNEMRVKGGRVA